jgi:hypothetical protein
MTVGIVKTVTGKFMKRSEMVINIAIELMSRLPEWEKSERSNFASEILQAIEIQGMIPPYIESDLGYCERCDSAEWEDEDD